MQELLELFVGLVFDLNTEAEKAVPNWVKWLFVAVAVPLVACCIWVALQ